MTQKKFYIRLSEYVKRQSVGKRSNGNMTYVWRQLVPKVVICFLEIITHLVEVVARVRVLVKLVLLDHELVPSG